MLKNRTTVYDWMGISEEEYAQRAVVGVCVKCGKPATSPRHYLCIGHKIAYHRWRNKKKLEAETHG